MVVVVVVGKVKCACRFLLCMVCEMSFVFSHIRDELKLLQVI